MSPWCNPCNQSLSWGWSCRLHASVWSSCGDSERLFIRAIVCLYTFQFGVLWLIGASCRNVLLRSKTSSLMLCSRTRLGFTLHPARMTGHHSSHIVGFDRQKANNNRFRTCHVAGSLSRIERWGCSFPDGWHWYGTRKKEQHLERLPFKGIVIPVSYWLESYRLLPDYAS